ncbi:tetratricopeptide repeat protein [uncultured Aquimarina sp.]|uniref:tetratricopeptide repeat-containing sensor histidine kinase n=1 Tax=uncultured Aquimarina sp. TaxID=575652 RepID=UPI0026158147|nr:tetratricopeptide repeat protein [uncultured Aquimarina sp.]
MKYSLSKKITLVPFILFSIVCISQNRAKIDSLKNIILNKSNDKANAYLQLSKLYKKKQLDSSIFFAKKLIDFRDTQDTISDKINARLNLADIYRTNKKYYRDAIQLDSSAITISLTNGLDSLTGRAYDHLGIDYLLSKKNDEAISSFLNSLKYSKTTGSPTQIATTTLRTGALYAQTGKLDEALKLLLPLTDYNKEHNISYSLKSTTYSYLGSTYQLIKDDEKALYYINKTYQIAKENERYSDMCVALVNKSKILRKESRFDEAILLLEEAKGISQNHKIARIEIAVFKNLGYAYSEMKLYEKSYEMFQKSAELSNKREDYFGEADLLCGLGIAYFKNKEYNNSEKTFKKSLGLYKKYGDDYQWKKLAVMIYESLVSIDSIKGNYKSEVQNLREKIRLKDSISDFDQKEKIASLELTFENLKKDKQIKLLEAKDKINTIQATKDGTFKIALVITGILLAFLVLLIYNRYKTKEKSLKTINSQKESLIQKNKENTLLSQEIHHRVKNNLQIILSLLKTSSEKLKENPEKGIEILKESQNKIKSISIIHQNLYHKGNIVSVSVIEYFSSLLKNLGNSYQDKNLEVIHFKKDIENIQIPMSLAVPLGLIANELITNIYKYAFKEITNDKEVYIAFAEAKKDSHFILTIKDNGIGMNTDDIPKNSFGLEMVKGLVAQHLGSMTIKNDKGLSYVIELKNEETT